MGIDAIKAPRTHAAWEEAMKDAVDSAEPLRFMLNHSCKLEYELNAVIANEAIAENKAYILEKELKKANNRIKRLEEALAEIAYAASHPLGAGQSLTLGKIESIAIKAKEAKP